MKERGILFSSAMVRSLLAGTKTQTRRVVKPHRGDDAFVLVGQEDGSWWPYRSPDGESMVMGDGCEYPFECKYGRAGDKLWVREAWRAAKSLDGFSPTGIAEKCLGAGYKTPWCPTQYEADQWRNGGWSGFDTPPIVTEPGRLRAGMHMPRWASRITLEIIEVRVERLQDISQADAMAEGAPPSHPSIDKVSREFGHPDFSRSWYAQLWEEINGPGSWEANPWVWCVSFKRVEAISG